MVNKGKKSIIEKHASDIGVEEAHHYTHLKVGILALRNNKRLARGSNEEYSDYLVIAAPRSYESSQHGGAMAHMADGSNEMNHRMKAQER